MSMKNSKDTIGNRSREREQVNQPNPWRTMMMMVIMVEFRLVYNRELKRKCELVNKVNQVLGIVWE